MSEIVLHLSAGQGPAECRWVVARLALVFEDEAARAGVRCTLLEAAEGNPASLLVSVTGEGAEAFAAARTGTILWTGASPFRPHHRRRNWFVGVSRVPPPEEFEGLRDEDVTYQAMRASGPGGQHVNKTDSAVRAIHRPTGLATVAQDQRSQHANRKLARLKLLVMLAEREQDSERAGRHAGWLRNRNLERGNAVRTYAGPNFEPRAVP
ncbi:peptide chain release factor H [Zavarzinia aquatilis]|uniref:Peptide chain release factor H n=1 Tax=Zavarzinia aquatilis TaxID=2211142 RepID=A0A317EE31_9PROT|nr:peptide chain release factor H [Zavarzinia aquatilis]PWR24524.1 peptide chain release factor H [Zavarzinia aquatilis]